MARRRGSRADRTDPIVRGGLRGPFADKDSREHFEIRTHNRLIDIKAPTKSTIDSLMHLDLPTGVDIEIKTVGGR